MPVRAADPSQLEESLTGGDGTAPTAVGTRDLERRREIGQFFTPPEVACFVWEMLDIIHPSGFPPQTRVIDPSCGEGVFLQVSAERTRLEPERLFGADIDEALLPLWRRDPILKHAQVFRGNGLLDMPARGFHAGTFDVVVGNPPFAGKGVRDLMRLLEAVDPEASRPEVDLFGAPVLQERLLPAGPPLTAPERAELDQLAKTLGGYACWRLGRKSPDDGEANPVDAEGAEDLFAGSEPAAKRKNGGSEVQRAAEMVATWPARRPLDLNRPETRLLFRRLASTAIEVFFMERFVRLAKPGGLIAVIVPESIVASDQLAPLRTWLLTQLQLLAVVGLPHKVFAGAGANAKTSVVFARRRRAQSEAPPKPDEPANGDLDDLDNPAGRKVLLAAPNVSAADYRLERYLADVGRAAREQAETFSDEGD